MGSNLGVPEIDERNVGRLIVNKTDTVMSYYWLKIGAITGIASTGQEFRRYSAYQAYLNITPEINYPP